MTRFYSTINHHNNIRWNGKAEAYRDGMETRRGWGFGEGDGDDGTKEGVGCTNHVHVKRQKRQNQLDLGFLSDTERLELI
jgi:hypothetical protein